MKTYLISILFYIRARIMRVIRPKESYFLFRNVGPISTRFGYDRGNPIDRYYIEKFLDINRKLIKGKCLEIHDSNYTKKFGDDRVTVADALDVDRKNKLSNIFSDIRDMSIIKDNTYDTLVITHTIGIVDDYEAAIRECYRILKPGGVLLFTSATIGPIWEIEFNYWRFTVPSAKYIFSKYFGEKNVKSESMGNCLAGQAFWVGMSVEDMTPEELNHNDIHFPVIVTVVATKVDSKKGH